MSEYMRGDHSAKIILKVKNNSLLACLIIISLVANEEKKYMRNKTWKEQRQKQEEAFECL